MTLRDVWLVLICIATLTLGLGSRAALAAPPAPAAPAAAVAQIRFSQAPPHKGQASTVGFALALTPDRTDEATMTVGTTIYQVKVGWMIHGPGAPLLEVEFEQRAPHQSPTRMDVTSPVKRGVRTVLGSIDRPDGSRATLDVTLR